MVETLPTPAQWRRFRRRQAWLAVPFLLLATVGLLAASGGELFGLALLLLFAPVGLLCVLNARSARRGGRSARLVTRDGAACLEFPGHRLGAVLLLVLVLVSFAAGVSLTLLYSWESVHGSVAAGAAAVAFAAITGYSAYRLWRVRKSGAQRGWPAVWLGARGVELAGPLGGWFMPWDVYPVPMPLANGVLRLVPLRALHELSGPLPKDRLLQLHGVPGSIPPALVDADLVVVAATVFLYGREPERRAELGTHAGLERVHGGELPPPWPDGT